MPEEKRRGQRKLLGVVNPTVEIDYAKNALTHFLNKILNPNI
jgi:hypothetical protein